MQVTSPKSKRLKLKPSMSTLVYKPTGFTTAVKQNESNHEKNVNGEFVMSPNASVKLQQDQRAQ